MSAPSGPPAWARVLVGRIVPRRDHEFLIADLDDEFRRRRARGQWALPWYLAQAVHAALTRQTPTTLVASGPRHTGLARGLATDLRLAWRSCRRAPGVTAAIVVSLGLGLGAATAMFSVVQAVLLAPLPYQHPDRLVTVWSRWDGFDRTWLSSTDVGEIAHESRLVDDIAMWTWKRVTLTGIGEAASLTAGVVTPNTFAVLGATPLYGRVFTESEARAATTAGQTMFAVLGYTLWRGTFGGDPAIVGRTITIDDRPVTIVGVMPPHFQLPTDFTRGSAAPTELWTPIAHDPAMNEHGYSYYGAARLRAGASVEALNAELSALATDFVRRGRDPAALHFTLVALPIGRDLFGGARLSLGVLEGAVFVLLLIGCANAAALLVARAETRRREWATRVALGAGRWRLLRQQFAEGALLSVAGGTFGLGLAGLTERTVDTLSVTTIPRLSDVRVDWRVVAFMLALSAVATVLSSVTPAIHAIRLNLVDGLRDGSANASAGRARVRFRGLLVVGQLALGLLLLTGAGLLGRTFLALRHVAIGVRAEGVLTARIALPASRYASPAAGNAYMTTLTGRLRHLPGIAAAGIVRVLPLGQTIGDWPVTIEGDARRPGDGAKGDWQVATPGALEALGERLVGGRFFTDDDTADAPVAVLVNETMAKMYWPGRDPVGRRLRFSNDAPLVWGTVVGVVGDVRHNGLTRPVEAKFYLPYAQFAHATGDKPVTDGTIVIRATGDPLAEVPALRAAAAAVDRTVPLSAVRPMTDVVDTALAAPRLTSEIMTGFSAVALLLSALGLFGLLVHLVAERRPELGLRMAVGAGAGDVVRLVLSQGLRVAGLGLAVGLALSVVALGALSNLLYGVAAWDPVTWLTAPAVLLVVTGIASVVPALRAAAIDPREALRRG